MGFFKALEVPVSVMAIVGISLFGFQSWSNLAIVYKTAFTEDCVAVQTPAGISQCESIPSKYDLVLVDPDATFADIANSYKH
jgi:hypothetical protein